MNWIKGRESLLARAVLSAGAQTLGLLVAPTAQGAEAKNFHSLMPKGLLNSPSYSQAIEIDKGKLVILAGQMPVDDKGALVGKGDFKVQLMQVFENIVLALKSAGLDTSDIVKLNYFIVGDLQQNRSAFEDASKRFFKPGTTPPAGTGVGVTGLALEGQMIEIDVTAVSRQ
jgi:2-iminobutanoate/2-iminopropanoate deaminase